MSRLVYLLLVGFTAAVIVVAISQWEYQKEFSVMMRQVQAAEFHAVRAEARAVKARYDLQEALMREGQCEDVVTQCCK